MKKKLYRLKNRMIGGVCAGLAEYLDMDASVVRISYVLLSILSIGFPGILVYILFWIIIPSE